MHGHYLRLDPKQAYPVMVRGEGAYLYDEQGNAYLDAAAGIAAVNIGYGHPAVAQAMAAQAGKLSYCAPNLFLNDATLTLAEALAEVAPAPIRYFHFTSGGSESTELALKIARQYHLARGEAGRHKIISRWVSYHGATLAGLAVSGMPARREKFQAMLMDVSHIDPPYCYRCPLRLTYPACRLACAAELEQAILEAGPATVSAFIIEPVIGSAGGGIVPPPGYHEAVRRICDRYGVLLIVDEVLTGFGRTGRMFAVEHSGVRPDVVVMAKGIGSGFPISAVGASAELMARWPTGSHGGTYGGNPIGCAAALATIEVLTEPGFAEHVRARGEQLLAGLRSIAADDPGFTDVRGLGLMVATQLADPARMAAITRHCLEEGNLLLMNAGTYGTVLRWMPPLVVTEDEVDLALGAFAKAVEATR